MFTTLAWFWKDDDGAVTVDWVVLVGAIAVLGLLIVMAIHNNLSDVTNSIEAELADAPGTIDTMQRTVAGSDWTE